MRKLLCLCTAMLLLITASAASLAETENTQSFAGVTSLEVYGALQHIVLTQTDGEEVVIRWVSDGTETIDEEDGHVSFAFAEPDWLDKDLPGDGSPRFSVVSTIYVDVPATVSAVTITTTLGDITASGITGDVLAEALEGSIEPETHGEHITEQPYDESRTSKHLKTTLPGAEKPRLTTLYTVLGSILLNE